MDEYDREGLTIPQSDFRVCVTLNPRSFSFSKARREAAIATGIAGLQCRAAAVIDCFAFLVSDGSSTFEGGQAGVRVGQGDEGCEGFEDFHEAREEAVAQGANVRDVPSPEDVEAREGAQVPAPECAQPQQARPLRGAQVPADDRVRHEEDRGQQHAGVHCGRARRQEEDQGSREEDVRHSDEEGQHFDQA